MEKLILLLIQRKRLFKVTWNKLEKALLLCQSDASSLKACLRKCLELTGKSLFEKLNKVKLGQVTGFLGESQVLQIKNFTFNCFVVIKSKSSFDSILSSSLYGF